GYPTANTHSPICTLSESPIFTIGRLEALTLISAKSVLGSRPMILASNVRLSVSCTSILSAFSTTWLLVTIYLSGVRITHEPGGVAANRKKLRTDQKENPTRPVWSLYDPWSA